MVCFHTKTAEKLCGIKNAENIVTVIQNDRIKGSLRNKGKRIFFINDIVSLFRKFIKRNRNRPFFEKVTIDVFYEIQMKFLIARNHIITAERCYFILRDLDIRSVVNKIFRMSFQNRLLLK